MLDNNIVFHKIYESLRLVFININHAINNIIIIMKKKILIS